MIASWAVRVSLDLRMPRTTRTRSVDRSTTGQRPKGVHHAHRGHRREATGSDVRSAQRLDRGPRRGRGRCGRPRRRTSCGQRADPVPHAARRHDRVRGGREPVAGQPPGRDGRAADDGRGLRHHAALFAGRKAHRLHRPVRRQHGRLCHPRGRWNGHPPDLPLGRHRGRAAALGTRQHGGQLDPRRQERAHAVPPRHLQLLVRAAVPGAHGRRTGDAAGTPQGRHDVLQPRRHEGRLQPDLPQLPDLEGVLRRPRAGHLDLRLHHPPGRARHHLEGHGHRPDVVRRHHLLRLRPGRRGAAQYLGLRPRQQELPPADPLRGLRRRLAELGRHRHYLPGRRRAVRHRPALGDPPQGRGDGTRRRRPHPPEVGGRRHDDPLDGHLTERQARPVRRPR